MSKHHKLNWRSLHKWGGLILTFFILMFCLSGIVLNHRKAFVNCQINSRWLPERYTPSQYNSGIVKGTLRLDGNRLLAYGSAGVWLTDRDFHRFTDYNAGLPKGIDGRNVSRVVIAKDGRMWCAAQYDLYVHDGKRWVPVPLPGNDERLTDVALDKDSLQAVALTRSAVYTASGPDGAFERRYIGTPQGYTSKASLFKTFWLLHSGALFGLPGRLLVDTVALVMIFLCFTGIFLFFWPQAIRRTRNKDAVPHRVAAWKWNRRWHNRLGYYTLVLTLLVTVTGMCLRKPLSAPLAKVKTALVPVSLQGQHNVWFDKLRGIRWDAQSDRWLVCTSEGFVQADEHFAEAPLQLSPKQTPKVSAMGVTVWEEERPGEWLVGSFSGLYRWDSATGTVTGWAAGEPAASDTPPSGKSKLRVSGYSRDLRTADEVVFDYYKGAPALSPMSGPLTRQAVPLWRVALDIHVGRFYAPLLGPLSDEFVFFSGLLITVILLSGLAVYYRQRRRRPGSGE